MNFLSMLFISLIAISCASKGHRATEYENIPHEHSVSENKKVAYEGKCAMGVLQDHCDRKANKNISYEYKYATYFFSSEEAKKEFIRDIDNNIKKSDLVWERNQRRIERK